MVPQPLDLERIMMLVADAMEPVVNGGDHGVAAAILVGRHHPTLDELEAARRENLEVHGAGTPEILRQAGLPDLPISPDVLRLRQGIDDVLVAAIALTAK